MFTQRTLENQVWSSFYRTSPPSLLPFQLQCWYFSLEQTFPLASPQHHFTSFRWTPSSPAEVHIIPVSGTLKQRLCCVKPAQPTDDTWTEASQSAAQQQNNTALQRQWSESAPSPNSAFPLLSLAELSAVIDEVTLTLRWFLKALLPLWLWATSLLPFSVSQLLSLSPLSLPLAVGYQFSVCHFSFPSRSGWGRCLSLTPSLPSNLLSHFGRGWHLPLSLCALLSLSRVTVLDVFLLI